MKKIYRNVIIIAILIGLGTILNTQNILFGNITTIENSTTTRYDGVSSDIELTGANYTDVTIRRWGYTIFGIIIIVSVILAIRFFKKQDTPKVLKSLMAIYCNEKVARQGKSLALLAQSKVQAVLSPAQMTNSGDLYSSHCYFAGPQ